MVLLPLGNSSLEVRVVINTSTANLVSVSKQEQDLLPLGRNPFSVIVAQKIEFI